MIGDLEEYKVSIRILPTLLAHIMVQFQVEIKTDDDDDPSWFYQGWRKAVDPADSDLPAYVSGTI